MFRIGNGYDVHRLVEGRKLILGGVEIPHTLGLDGHSDADALLHALCDALLGAAGLGDLGHHFPDTDDQYKGISSLVLLEKVNASLHEKGFTVVNTDATLVAQKPKLAPFIGQMRENIARTLGIDISQVNVKATTTEKLGFAGREEGLAAYAVALIESR
ncbi:2C-methyl-D-erythritol 2,4-cyclodiphosphate synthase [Nitrospina gracilis 3/211]|uniref:2-C-methyl-D-erythritol 2,4-cyclodiphosphate synthase n=1 Tax=Nitrospina gracilis (strain 3/211) TaxID=1266370 RepID=M1YHW6_NITG3|nr:2-C-methyl-D-erythritol 2,4-cyclodiphosphate synthase [Nitrospina gracilis]MCF8723056.1 2-C-methyl-D-erythritol 2,4-cyclodiphosphate synthase [Nitrospina sp. Nb-3]CCQ90090.1 2C-methyl-D-erythritol 2,4-cyclodiphosphate synthase [Nitrospina gracilis 3/211]